MQRTPEPKQRTQGRHNVQDKPEEGPSFSEENGAKKPEYRPSDDLMRFSVAMPESLLIDFDKLVATRGLAKNRSEVVRDLVREALVEQRSRLAGTMVMGTLTIVYDHHSSDLQNKLHQIQHDSFDSIVSTMHVHVDSHICLEVIVLRGETEYVQTIANMILGTKGVKNGKLVLAAVEDKIHG